MISLTGIAVGFVVAVAAIAAGIRNGQRLVPKYTSQGSKSELSRRSEPTLRSVFIRETKWNLLGHVSVMSIVFALAAFGLFEDNAAAEFLGILTWAYALYRLARWSTVAVCLGDRPTSAPDFSPTASES